LRRNVLFAHIEIPSLHVCSAISSDR
jgi:hypothetical protein